MHRSQVLTSKELFTNMVVDLHRSLEKVIEAAETKSAASLAAVDLHRLLDGSGIVRRPVKTKKNSTHVTLLPMAMILLRSLQNRNALARRCVLNMPQPPTWMHA